MSKNGKPTLLVVEDDPGLQKQMRWGFDNYEVVVAGDCESAVAQMRRFEPAVMTLDLGLPPDPDGVSQGFETLSKALECWRRLNFDPLCRPNFDPGLIAGRRATNCG